MIAESAASRPKASTTVDRLLYVFTAFGLSLNGPFLLAPTARATAALMTAACIVLAASTAHPRYRGRVRIAAAVGYRLAWAAAAQKMTSGGRWIPRRVNGWGSFIAGRALPLMFLLQTAVLQLESGAHTVAAVAASVAVFAAGQAAVCPALLEGYLGSAAYFEASAAALRAAAAAGAAALGVADPGAAAQQPPFCASHACTAVMTSMFAAAGALGAVVGGARVPGGGVRATLAVSIIGLLLLWGAIDAVASQAPCTSASAAAACPPRGAFAERREDAGAPSLADWTWARQLAAWPARVAADARSLAGLAGW